MGDAETTQQATQQAAQQKGSEAARRAEVSPPELSRAVISVLGRADHPMSIREIEREVGELLKVTGPAPVEGEVSALEQMRVVERGADGHKLFRLSEQGRELATGIEILSRA